MRAELAHGVRRYARVRVALGLLGAAIEAFREKNEAPLLGAASRLFATLSLGSFEALRIDHTAHPAVLVGTRPRGSWVRVEDMSDGARDQLFLSLRLAAVVQRLEQGGEPMPFVVDDILVNFDDRRTEATLTVLAQMAERTQVVLFTHHERVVETAQRVAGTAGVFVHRLGVGS